MRYLFKHYKSPLVEKYNLRKYPKTEEDKKRSRWNWAKYILYELKVCCGMKLEQKQRKLLNRIRRKKNLGMTNYQFLQFKKIWLKRKNHRCQFCGVRLYQYPSKKMKHREITVDHFIPLWDGGKNEEDNLQILCQDCHTQKENVYPMWKTFTQVLKNLYNEDITI